MNANQFTLRQLRKDEVHSLFPIHRAAFHALVEEAHGGMDEETWRKGFIAELTPADTRVVDVEGTTAGWVHIERNTNEWFIRQVVIAPTMQGHGLGTALMKRIMNQAEDVSAALCLSVYRVNRAQSLYFKLGFESYASDPTRIWLAHNPGDHACLRERLLRALMRMGNQHRFQLNGQGEFTGQIHGVEQQYVECSTPADGTLNRLDISQIDLNTLTYYADEWVTIDIAPQ